MMIEITHIHPMLVHFPVVLFLTTAAVNFLVLIRKGDLASRECLSLISLAAIGLGVVMAVMAAVFGDIALDAALDKGFDKAPLEEHEDLALTTIIFFAVLALIQGFSVWKRRPVAGFKTPVIFIASVVGIALLIATAYHGGHLVYDIGVNVTPVKP